jgi:hypothetical protein
MATASVVVDKVVEWTGLNGAVVAYAARYLRDAGLNPKGKPGGGTGAAHHHTDHVVALTAALLSTDTVTKAAEAATKTLNLARAEESGGSRMHDVSVQVVAARLKAEGRDDAAGQVEKGGTREPLVPGGTFGEAFSYLVDLARTPAGKSFVHRHVDSIEVSRLRPEAAIVFREHTQAPMTEHPDGTRTIHAVDAPEPRKIRQMYRPSQGDLLSQLMVNHRLKARVDVNAVVPGVIICALADLVLDTLRAERELSSRRRKTRSDAAGNTAGADTETTTPAQDATGPASADAMASQPSRNSVNSADDSNQQDSGRKKRGQSSPSSTPHGSPSSDVKN